MRQKCISTSCHHRAVLSGITLFFTLLALILVACSSASTSNNTGNTTSILAKTPPSVYIGTQSGVMR
jgi:hypothetical protein